MKYWRIFRELIIPALLAFNAGLWAYWLTQIKMYGEVRLYETNQYIIAGESTLATAITLGAIVEFIFRVNKFRKGAIKQWNYLNGQD